ncbi:solute carrier family 66 member 3 [Salmo salar]|uniref:Solute carrier family 66 member 3 n=2 Tax=Salmo TaxID=8028 RepID=B5XAJ5_SALSA|nr:solute carrier family 66 member 3 [Salmo salar]XP_029569085.1 PQ-loop repeat-containing protein 3 isoform X1 [Salmo trutta]ACI67865.1 PQ loop repeat-containing protein 3 precursor [Salmo salar]
MESDKVLHVANFSTLFVCMVLKFPQIFVLMRAKSTTGVSLNSLLLELTGFIVFVTYQMYYDYPPPTYLEYPILIAQDVILLLLILHYNGSLKQSLIYAVVFVGGWQLLTVQKWIIDLAMSLCTFISAGSKFAQLQCLWQSKDSGQVSALSWGMATYTCFARIYTTSVTTGDMQVLVRFIVMALLNSWVLASVLYYRKRAGEVQKKQD